MPKVVLNRINHDKKVSRGHTDCKLIHWSRRGAKTKKVTIWRSVPDRHCAFDVHSFYRTEEMLGPNRPLC